MRKKGVGKRETHKKGMCKKEVRKKEMRKKVVRKKEMRKKVVRKKVLRKSQRVDKKEADKKEGDKKGMRKVKPTRCIAETGSGLVRGGRCRLHAVSGSEFCHVHNRNRRR